MSLNKVNPIPLPHITFVPDSNKSEKKAKALYGKEYELRTQQYFKLKRTNHMSDISNKFLRPNLEGRYYAQQSQVFYGLWTPYGVMTPLFMGVWPDGSIDITYNMRRGASFTKAQKQKIKYVKKRGVEVRVTHVDAEGNDE